MVKTLICVLVIFFFRISLKMSIEVSNNYRCAFIHIDAFMNAIRYICLF